MIEPRTYGDEPTLAETLSDPIIQQMMISDGVTTGDVLQLVAIARRMFNVDDGDGVTSLCSH